MLIDNFHFCHDSTIIARRAGPTAETGGCHGPLLLPRQACCLMGYAHSCAHSEDVSFRDEQPSYLGRGESCGGRHQAMYC